MIKKVTLLNTSIITHSGFYSCEDITLQDAKKIIANSDKIESAIGHESTANILTELLEYNVEVNRINYVQEKGDVAIVFKLEKRPPEGKILTKEEIENIGYKFQSLVRLR